MAYTRNMSKSILIGTVSLYVLKGVSYLFFKDSKGVYISSMKRNFIAANLWEVGACTDPEYKGILCKNGDFIFFIAKALFEVGLPVVGARRYRNVYLGVGMALVQKIVFFVPYFAPLESIMSNCGMGLLMDSFRSSQALDPAAATALDLLASTLSTREKQITMLAVMQCVTGMSAYNLLRAAFLATQGRS